ncbi:MAG: hypothetical protein R3F62_15445 [Planctomycetota bacterium]
MPLRLCLCALVLVLSAGCASRRVDVLERGVAVLRVRPKRPSAKAGARALAAIEEALAPEQFLDPRVRGGFEGSLGGALTVDPAGVLVGQNPVTFPLPLPEGVQVAVGYGFEPPRVEPEDDALRVQVGISVAMALLEVPAPAEGSYDGLAVWAALGYLARSLQDAGFRLDEDTEARLARPPFRPALAD